MTETYFARKAEFGKLETEAQLARSEDILLRCYNQAERALGVMRKLRHFLANCMKGGAKRRRVSVRFAWQQILRQIKKEIRLGSLDIVEHLPERFPVIACERSDFKEILYLITKNAVQALLEKPAEQKVLVIRVQHVFSASQEPTALITIADTGPGIPQRHLHNLFQPFFSTKDEPNGNGLGLYLAKKLVAKNHGKIHAASYESFGTTFSIELPLYDAAKKTAPTA
ncbi:HAMP domain-containing histidine kinase [Omnitrophica bacterium]|nr:HAMP domain-containing histidine kinase [Candidatus Omnitrophota bacterium]